ncbi:hypothetical protein BTV98_06305 [Psychrobacter sp. Cmf 22.2]|nr:hypothetical protein BTV98_06305 [Psychrobacter sp. Cmf 22.2]
MLAQVIVVFDQGDTMKNLQDLRIFIETARLGSLSACARHLDLSSAVVSAAVKRLEAEIDTVLFICSTRRLRLTGKDEQYLKHCRDAVDILDNAYAGLHDNDADLTGTIRLSASSDLGRNLVLPWLDDFMQIHPNYASYCHVTTFFGASYSYQCQSHHLLGHRFLPVARHLYSAMQIKTSLMSYKKIILGGSCIKKFW